MARFRKCTVSITGDWCCVEEAHYAQYRRVYHVFIFENSWNYGEDKTWEIYYQKKGYPLMYGFGVQQDDADLEQAFELAWGNLWKYKKMFA